MAAFQALIVFIAAFSWIFLLSGVMKEQKDKSVVIQEGRGLRMDIEEDAENIEDQPYQAEPKTEYIR